MFLTREEIRERLAALKSMGGSDKVIQFIEQCERRLDAEERQDAFLDEVVDDLFNQRIKRKDAYNHVINY